MIQQRQVLTEALTRNRAIVRAKRCLKEQGEAIWPQNGGWRPVSCCDWDKACARMMAENIRWIMRH